jgi:hypothetical protein
MQFGQRATIEPRTVRPGQQNGGIAPPGDAVFRGQRQRPLDNGFGRGVIAALVMQPGGKPQRDDRGQRMLQFLGQTQRIGERVHRSAVITEQPAVRRKVPAAAGTGIVAAVEERLRGVAFAIVEREPALHMLDRRPRAPAAR